MGTLDQAIREHLELKRRAGADAGEVAKLEREAFGPIRRDDALAAPPRFDDDADAPPKAAPAPAASEPAPAAPFSPDGPAGFADPSGPLDPFAPLPPTGAHLAASPPAAPEDDRPRAPAAPLPPVTPPAPPDELPAGERTVEFSALDHAEATAPSEGDELEATPEFLEETPEHDRLWFEQKPPRDFDF